MPKTNMFSPFSQSKLTRYLYGDCLLLALALNERTGWPVVQIVEGDAADPDVRHALVRMPDGRLLDAAGPHSDYSGEEPLDAAYWQAALQGPWPERDPRIVADAGRLLRAIGAS